MSKVKWLVMAVGLGLVLGSLPVASYAQVPPGEVLYLVDSTVKEAWDGISRVFQVHLDPAAGAANLEELPTIPANMVQALACTPDGKTLYGIDRYKEVSPGTGDGLGFGHLWSWTVGDATGWQDLGALTYWTGSAWEILQDVVLAAVRPDGTLCVASGDTNMLYRVDLGTRQALDGRLIVRTDLPGGPYTVELAGADLAFQADSTAYIWTNTANPAYPVEAPRGLYRLNCTGDPITATLIAVPPTNGYFTGIAVRANGLGNSLAGSAHYPRPDTLPEEPDVIHSLSLVTGMENGHYVMKLGGVDYVYGYGDMSNGAIGILCTRTIGWYKNHDWYVGSPTFPMSATICGHGITQTGVGGTIAGQDFLNGVGFDKKPNGTDFSMLFAQLLAAKLNAGDTGTALIDETEAWLYQQGFSATSPLDLHAPFANGTQGMWANHLASLLDYFNNSLENNCGSFLRSINTHMSR